MISKLKLSKSRSFFFKLFFYTIMLISTATIITATILSSIYLKVATDEIGNVSEKMIIQSSYNCDLLLNWAKSYSDQIFFSTDVQKFVLEDEENI